MRGVYTEIVVRACDKTPSFQFNARLSKRNRWIIGPYRELCRLAQELRYNAQVRSVFFDCQARLGRRATDVPPLGARSVTGFRSLIKEKSPKSSDETLKEKFSPLRTRAEGLSFEPRFTDQFDEVANFYKDKTLEAHHIVEKSILKTLGVNGGELADEQAPCVLIVAELHQRLFTTEVTASRGLFSKGMKGDDVYRELKKIYDALYRDSVMEDLRDIAEIINREVQVRLST